MVKLEKTWWIGVTIAEFGVIAAVIFGLKGSPDALATALLIAGVAAWIAIGALELQKLRCPF